MQKNNYIYPAIFTQYEDSIGITFPDLPGCVSNADNLDEAVQMAREVLALHLFGMEEDNIQIPLPTPINKVSFDKDEIPILIDVYMPLYRQNIRNTTVKTTVTMPQWLKEVAEKEKINFSATLQEAIKSQLHL